MLVLAGQDTKWALPVLCLYIKDFCVGESLFGCPPLCQICLCGSVHVGGAQWTVSRAVGRVWGLRGFGAGPLGGVVSEKPRGGMFCHVAGFSSTPQRGGKRKVRMVWPFCTFFWTRVAITAPMRPKRIKPGSKAAWVLGNQPFAGYARRFGRLARQHLRGVAHKCPFQGQKGALGARSNTRAQPRFAANTRAQSVL